MKGFFITGASGNIGQEVVRSLIAIEKVRPIILGVRNIEKARKKFPKAENLEFQEFDFKNPNNWNNAFQNIEIIFLLRPPSIANVSKYFSPLLKTLTRNKILKIVFLSVQGVEKSKAIPHHKIENEIIANGFNYIFVRPSYFMQNLTGALLPDIRNKKSIFLPSGNAKFNWIDCKDIGLFISTIMKKFDQYQNQAFEVTGNENLSFMEVSTSLSQIGQCTIHYKSINPVSYILKKAFKGDPWGFAIITCLLHFLPRFNAEPHISHSFNKVTGRQPIDLNQFIDREKYLLFPK